MSEQNHDKEFNLLDEPWICVMLPDCTVREVSLKEVFSQAHTFRGLAGELVSQDTAVLRLLLAVLYRVFSQVNVSGEENEPGNDGEAVERWAELWSRGNFPEEPIFTYLEKYRDRFWLFHPVWPFYQVPDAARGTEYGASKLNGELSESSNKLRLFPSRTGEYRSAVTYAEAARWLLYVNGYDDTSAKPKKKGLPSPGAGWLGRLGLIMADGDNLFETLMLNLTFLQDGEKMWRGDSLPVWELPEVRSEERTQISVPDNPAALFTLQSRRLLLKREGEKVIGYSLLGGDFFSGDNAFEEQMTVWKRVEEKGKKAADRQPIYRPRRHDPSHQMWRDFASFVDSSDINSSAQGHKPGVISWVEYLQAYEITDQERLVRFRISSVQYGDKDFFITDEFSDSLTFYAGLLTEKGKAWRMLAQEMVLMCDDLAYCISKLAQNLIRARIGQENGDKGGKREASACNRAKEQLYYRFDIPFRRWLCSLNPDMDGEICDIKRQEWQEEAWKITMELGREMVAEAGPRAITGRMVEGKAGGEEKKAHYSAAEAFNNFQYMIKKRTGRTGNGDNSTKRAAGHE
ncbi:MAG: type I-E CRISPR-associated protein Cse1/CasA [Clostridiales bacterium]|nr:type I-E CRISPR-associated protein Cse1/CasA [Clostridiales bacterium]